MKKYFQNLLAKSLNLEKIPYASKSRLSAIYENLAKEIAINEILNQNSQNSNLPDLYKNSANRLRTFISKFQE